MNRQLLSELYEALERDASNIAIREAILEQWVQAGNQEMAKGVAEGILARDPSNIRARAVSQTSPPGTARPPTRTTRPGAGQRSEGTRSSQGQTEMDTQQLEAAFEEGHHRLKCGAELLEQEIKALQNLGNVDDDKVLQNLRGLLEGRMTSIVSKNPPRPVRQLVRELTSDRDRCQELVVEDFDEMMAWVRSENPSADADTIRTRLRQRQGLLEAALPADMAELAGAAMMHVERELTTLGRRYANTETMLGDELSDVPSANFLVTEDNYAWDMEELANALEVNNGVMRNPLSKDMFSADDVRKILAHPLGQRLRPLRLEQSQLKKGVRAATLDRMAGLSKTMLEDQSPTAGPSMQAVDEFLVYVAALPAEEQRTLEALKVPAKDSHTGQAYDYTISESVRDAKANRTCFHKTGDFLGQAVKYLRKA